jgi:hypothetical protein
MHPGLHLMVPRYRFSSAKPAWILVGDTWIEHVTPAV